MKALVEQTYTKHGTMVYGRPLWTYAFKTHSMDYPSAPITPVSEEELYRLSGQILGTLRILGYTTRLSLRSLFQILLSENFLEFYTTIMSFIQCM